MKLVLLSAFLAVVAKAWNVPRVPRTLQLAFAKGCATAAVCAALASPAQATAGDAAVNVYVKAPYVLDLVKTKSAREQTLLRAQYIVESIKSLVGPAVSVELPSDVRGFVKRALSGGATVAINGQDVTVQVVQSQAGALTVQLSNKFIPAIPFAGLDNTPAVVNAVADKAAEAAPGVLGLVQKTMNSNGVPFWDQPIAGGRYRLDYDFGAYSIHRPATLIDVVGTSSLGLGAAYAGSFAFYKYEQDREAKAAADKKQAMAGKRAGAAAKKKKSAEKKAEPKATKESEPVQKPDTAAPSIPSKPEAPQVANEPAVAVEEKVLLAAEASTPSSSAEKPSVQRRSRRWPKIMLRRSS